MEFTIVDESTEREMKVFLTEAEAIEEAFKRERIVAYY